jgi:hypothetical protein
VCSYMKESAVVISGPGKRFLAPSRDMLEMCHWVGVELHYLDMGRFTGLSQNHRIHMQSTLRTCKPLSRPVGELPFPFPKALSIRSEGKALMRCPAIQVDKLPRHSAL